MALTDKLTAIGDAIRSKMETTELIPLAEMPNKVNEVFEIGSSTGYSEGHLTGYSEGQQEGWNNGYEAGRKAEHDQFWDAIQNNGKRTGYSCAFASWGAEYIRPKYKIIATGKNDGAQMFNNCENLKKVEADYFDFSQKPTGTNNDSGFYYTFYLCRKLEEVEDIGLSPQYTYHTTFGSCENLHTIAKIRIDENTRFTDTFYRCAKLQSITIEGTLGQNGFNVSACPLTHDSLMSIINALKTFTDGTTKTVTLGATNIAKLTDAEKAIATQKGWTLA
jgi:hypothetical protein